MNTQTIQITPPRAFSNPPAAGEYAVPTVRNDQGGTVISAQRSPTENPVFGFLPLGADGDSPALKSHLETLNNCIELATAAIAAKAKDVHPQRMPETAYQIVVNHCCRSFKDTIVALQEMKRNADTGRKEFVDLHTVNSSIAAPIAAYFVSMERTAILQTIVSMDANQLAVLLAMRGLVELPDDIWRDIQIRYVITANLAGDRSDGVAIAAKKPSLDDPAAIGVDKNIVTKWAEARMKYFDKQENRVDEVAATMQNICTVLAVACDKSPNEIWLALYA